LQIDPIKPKLKAPGTKLLKLKWDGTLLKFAFKLNLRRYILDPDCEEVIAPHPRTVPAPAAQGRAVQVDPLKPNLNFAPGP